ncbi:hypothetical protein Hanom_Chr07g00631701 [Helianthus anomalus]
MGYPFYTLHDLIIQLPHKLHRAHTSSNSVSLCFTPTHHRTGSRRLCNSAVVRSCHATVSFIFFLFIRYSMFRYIQTQLDSPLIGR